MLTWSKFGYCLRLALPLRYVSFFGAGFWCQMCKCNKVYFMRVAEGAAEQKKKKSGLIYAMQSNGPHPQVSNHMLKLLTAVHSLSN